MPLRGPVRFVEPTAVTAARSCSAGSDRWGARADLRVPRGAGPRGTAGSGAGRSAGAWRETAGAEWSVLCFGHILR